MNKNNFKFNTGIVRFAVFILKKNRRLRYRVKLENYELENEISGDVGGQNGGGIIHISESCGNGENLLVIE
ncbi:MAG: hypothetical protein ACR2F2_04945 [Pyrinomonadaceae bacterium]